jgi:hypothetical protein
LKARGYQLGMQNVVKNNLDVFNASAMSSLLVTVLMQTKAIGFKHIHVLEPMDLFIYGSDNARRVTIIQEE